MGYSDWISYGGGHFCFIMGAACMMIPGGYLADLYSARHVMLIGGILSFAIFYFIIFAGGISLSIILTALFLLGATLALMNPIAVSLGVKMEPARSGAVSAFLMGVVWCVSEALGPAEWCVERHLRRLRACQSPCCFRLPLSGPDLWNLPAAEADFPSQPANVLEHIA